VALSPLTFGATLIPGLCLLIPATIGTGITNNIWPRKFRPRNGHLGISRATLTPQKCVIEIEKIRAQKAAIKQFKAKYMPVSAWLSLKRVGAKLISALPFGSKWGGTKLHQLTQAHFLRHQSLISKHSAELRFHLDLQLRNSFSDEYLVTQYLKELRYRQYGINDFYWALRKEMMT
jgi:hypothetical protein